MSKKINISLQKEQRLGQIGINNQEEKITIIAYRNSRDIDVQFEDGIILTNRNYDDFLRGKIAHPIKYEQSFAYHIEVELGLNINKIWNFEKNTVSPYEITKQSNKKVWLYCQEKDYHNNEEGYEVSCNSFYRGSRCSYCGNHKIHKLDSLGYLYPQIAEMIVTDERNNLTMEDLYEIAPCSHKNFYFKCDKCKRESNSKKELHNIIRYGFSCEYCSDNISIPNKILRQISKQLELNWKFEHMEDWLEKKRLDGYDDNFKIAIEMDGNYGNHEENKEDQWKDEQCLKHGIYIIRVNLMNDKEYYGNTFEYIKKQILDSSLPLIYDFSNFDWELAWKNSLKSLVWEVKKLFEEGYSNIEIAEILDIGEKTVREYKRQLGIKNQYEKKQENLLKTKDLLQQDKSIKQIAEMLGVSMATIRNYKKELNL